MELFDIFNIDSTIDLAYWEGSVAYCNPKDYFVSKAECEKYLEDLRKGNKLNSEYNKKRRSKWLPVISATGIVLGVILYLLGCFLGIKSGYDWAAFALSVACVLYLFAFYMIYVKFYEYFTKTYWGGFYPKVNENIEKLFNDYLWKKKILYESLSKRDGERSPIYQRIVELSHPGLEQFVLAVEKELKSPSEDCVFGDVAFGMTTDEIYKTEVFKDLSLEDYGYVCLGFRKRYLENYFNISCLNVSFINEKDRLTKVSIKSWSFNAFDNYNEDLIETFISCCEKLNLYYGNPCNLYETIRGKFELFPNNKAEFHVGKKTILLQVIRAKSNTFENEIELTFSQEKHGGENIIKKRTCISNYPFNVEWFDGLRRMYYITH